MKPRSVSFKLISLAVPSAALSPASATTVVGGAVAVVVATANNTYLRYYNNKNPSYIGNWIVCYYKDEENRPVLHSY